MAQSPSSPHSPPPESAAGNEPRRVLLLEDNDFVVRLVIRTLKPRGWTVVVVPDGLRAFQELDALAYRAVIADEVLPAGPGGARVLERVRRLYDGVRLVWLSGYEPGAETVALLTRIRAIVLRKGQALPKDIIAAVEGPEVA